MSEDKKVLGVDSFIIVGTIIHSTKLEKIDILEDYLILIKKGKIITLTPSGNIKEIQKKYNIADSEVIQLGNGEFLMPGMIDTHIHAPQYPNIGLGSDKTLLEWLSKYTYPLEKQYSDVNFATKVYSAVVKHTVACGTTTACYFATIHLQSSMILADIVEKVGQRGLIGKINMNINYPEGYGEETANSLRDTETFIKYIQQKQNSTLLPVITPRFAISCDMDLMTKLGVIAKTYDVHIQTHISENCAEIEAVKQLFPDCKNYADVYNKANLLTSKTILAHGVHLEDAELKMLAATGAAISHCPNSNTNLRSGLCNVRRLLSAGIKVGLGTDVSGGYSPSIIDAMHKALSVGIHLSFNDEKLSPLNYHEIFYLATLGGAQALALDEKIGNFMIGKDFDALVVNMNPSNTPNAPGGLPLNYKIEEYVQKFIYTGDDRNITRVFVAGKQIK
ncbi:guanine deaminase [Anabrus simplex]|uniref:guanine deaminase n=1 Tax=Anabrus simplex TaxID=316456 RepID=UPI0035A31597